MMFSGLFSNPLPVGAPAPDFSLPDDAGRTVTLLRIVAPGKRIELSGGSDLTRVRDYIWARVPHHALRSCSVPFSS